MLRPIVDLVPSNGEEMHTVRWVQIPIGSHIAAKCEAPLIFYRGWNLFGRLWDNSVYGRWFL